MDIKNKINRLKNENIAQILKKRFFGQAIDFNADQYEVEVLCEAEERHAEVPIHFENHITRLTGYDGSLQVELDWIYQTDMLDGPTRLYKLNNIRVGSTGIWTDAGHYIDRNVKKNRRLEEVNLKSAILVDNNHSSQYFGHWLTDFMPAALVASKDRPGLSVSKPDYFHASEYTQLLDIDNIIYSNKGFIEEFYFLDDHFTMNSYKIKRYHELSQRIKSKITSSTTEYVGVYIVRGNLGAKRNLENEEQLCEHLAKKGFYILHLGDKTPTEIASILLDTPFVISVEGSALSHAIYTAAKSAGQLLIIPPNRSTFFFKAILDAIGFAWGFYVCLPGQDKDSFYLDSFDDLDKLIDQIRDRAAKKTDGKGSNNDQLPKKRK